MSDPTPDIMVDMPDDDPGLRLFAAFGLKLDTISGELVKANRREQARIKGLPNYYVSEQLAQNVTGTKLVDFGTPQNGRKWILRLLMAISIDLAANAALCSWFIGPLINSVTFVPTSLRWQFPSLPGIEKFTSNTLTVLPLQHLYAWISNAPANSNIALAAAFNEEPMFPQSAVVSSE